MSDVAAFLKMLSLITRSKDVSVEKLNATIAAIESERRRLASLAFTAALIALQAELPEIDENGAMFRDGKEISKYSKWEDIQRVLKPLLINHGFTLTFHNDFPSPGFIEVVAVLTHRDGHHAENAFRLRADDSMANENQAMGSSQSYGMRYSTLGLLNIITRGQDVDAGERILFQALQGPPFVELSPEVGARYQKAMKTWWKAAGKGRKTFERSLDHSPDDLVSHLIAHDTAMWRELKQQADSKEMA